jgi:predicted RNA-binding Zn-ribbon protein involved in translation (DUF1610 family)
MRTRTLVPQEADRLGHGDLVVDLAAGGRIVGDGRVNYVCPHCRSKLLVGLSKVLPRTVFRCASCRGYSRMERRAQPRKPATSVGPPLM